VISLRVITPKWFAASASSKNLLGRLV